MFVNVQVWTRGVNNIRGVAAGFLVAFDKHWNLALRDVDEEFTRKRSRKTLFSCAGDSSGGRPAVICGQKLMPCDLPVEVKVGGGASLLRVVKIRGKFEVCVRHVAQVLLRGEHVVMVAPVL
jgi:small nuclear ribonucleoprotein (snRNP)-like protein